jgi:trans-aconitate 2-methyltransferase
MAWSAATYLKFGEERTRAAIELLSRVRLDDAKTIADLGCGPGNSTALLRARYPEAELIGVDNAPDMIATAEKSGVTAKWILADVASWAPSAPLDLLYANATFQWLDDHPRLFPRLASQLAPGGVLAVQMPSNFAAPSHVILRAVASEGPWAERLRPILRHDPVVAPEAYYRWLSPHAASLDVWSTEYLQVLKGADPVLSWVRGTALVPILDALLPEQRADFESEYRARLRAAYPPEPSGETLFPFRRLFVVLTKPR